MKILTLSRDEAASIFILLKDQGEIPLSFFNDLSFEYKELRNDLLAIESKSYSTDSYKRDLSFATSAYQYFCDKKWFNESVAGNYGFWRYVSLKVVPDLIFRRCGFVETYFYEKTTRMYVPKLWWFIHMSYQGNIEKTTKILEPFNTDYIMQLVERTGRNGFYLEITREIMRTLSLLPLKVINKKVNDSNLFRRVLIQNTAKMDNYNLVAENNPRKYVYDLFKSCKVEVEDYE